MDNTTVVTAKYGTVITTVGLAKIAAAVLHGTKVNIIHAAVGDGGGAYYKPTQEQTGLKNECWRGEIAYARTNDTNPNVIDVKFIVPDEVGGFFVREACLFDRDGDMIAICNTPDAEKVAMIDGVSFPLKMMMHLAVLDSKALKFTIDASLDTVSREELEAAMEDLSANVGSVIIKDITIPADAWVETAEAGKYKFVADAADMDALDEHYPSLALDIASLDIASAAGMCPTIETLDGRIRFWVKEKPAADLVGTLKLESQSAAAVGSSGGVASDKEASDAAEEVFGAGGTVVPNQAVIAADSEVASEVSGIFGV